MKLKNPKLILVALALNLFAIACTKTSPNSSLTPTPITTTAVKLANDAKLGRILTDDSGHALYFFANDVAGSALCTGQCNVTWPAFYQENLTVGAGLKAVDFTVITLADGSKQTAYKGWPLYRFISDEAGQTGGDGINNVWYIAKPDYAIMIGNAQLVGSNSLNYTANGIAGTGSSLFFTDANGKTLYLFTHDTPNTNVFTTAVNNDVWPISEPPAADALPVSYPSILNKALFTTITVSAIGKTQVVYKGHPLYTLGIDNGQRGSTKGVSFPEPGAGIWKVVNMDTQ